MSRIQEKTLRLVQLSLLAAIIVVLQQIVIPLPGGLTLSLTLVPIVVGAALFGPAAGAVLGGVFGAVVTFLVITGRAGELSTMMWLANPVMTVLICLLKGVAAGWLAGLLAHTGGKDSILRLVLAAAVAPVANTGIFLLGMLTVFRGTMLEFAARIEMPGISALYFAAIVLVGLNFMVEFAANVLLSPAIAHIVRTVRRLH